MELVGRDAGSIDECAECGEWAGFGHRCPECIRENRQELRE